MVNCRKQAGFATFISTIKPSPQGAGGAEGYTAPKGGGGVTSTIESNGNTIDFGHGGRHLEGTGLDVNQVNKALADHVSNIDIGVGEFYKGQITVAGKLIEYRAYGVQDGTIKIGTYYIK